MKIKPLPPYYPTFKQKDKLTGKHQFFANQIYSAGKTSDTSSNQPAIVDNLQDIKRLNP